MLFRIKKPYRQVFIDQELVQNDERALIWSFRHFVKTISDFLEHPCLISVVEANNYNTYSYIYL